MGTLNAFYVRAQADNGEVIAAIHEWIPDAEIEATPQFLGVMMPEDAFEAPEAELEALSSRFGTDVIWLAFQSVVDAFEFHHWRAGERVRTLVYGCFQEERTWERVEGQAEPWEREAFFRQRWLEPLLEYARSEAEREEYRRIWREAEILPGRTEPGFDSRNCAIDIAAYYQLPHYGS